MESHMVQSVHLVFQDVREKIEFQVSRICNACHVSPSLKDMEHVMKMIMETGTSFIKFLFLLISSFLQPQTLPSDYSFKLQYFERKQWQP